MSPTSLSALPCLESFWIPLSYLLSCFCSESSCSFCFDIFLLMLHSPDIFLENSQYFFVVKSCCFSLFVCVDWLDCMALYLPLCIYMMFFAVFCCCFCPFLFSFLFSLIWNRQMWQQHVLALCAPSTGVILNGLSLKKNSCLMFVHVCFDYVCLGIGFVDWQGFMYERFWSVRLFMTEFESLGVTLCGWQDVKIQSLTN